LDCMSQAFSSQYMLFMNGLFIFSFHNDDNHPTICWCSVGFSVSRARYGIQSKWGYIAVAPKKISEAVIVHSCLRSYRKTILHDVKLQNVVQPIYKGGLDTQSKTEPSRQKHGLRLVLNMITTKTNYHSSENTSKTSENMKVR
jgi:hypothetical protein